MKEAMRAKEATRLSVIRGLIAGFTNELVAKGKKPTDELSDEEARAVIKRQVKQRKDSIEQFEKGGRKDLADKEQEELGHLEKYLPATIGQDVIRKVAEIKKQELGITDKKDAGKLMSVLMKEFKGTADGSDVKAVVDEILG